MCNIGADLTTEEQWVQLHHYKWAWCWVRRTQKDSQMRPLLLRMWHVTTRTHQKMR